MYKLGVGGVLVGLDLLLVVSWPDEPIHEKKYSSIILLA